MPQVELIMPKMGESIMEATILKWVKNVGDSVELDETILEIATDKVDSEVPSPIEGVIAKILFEQDDVVAIGEVIAIISTDGEAVTPDAAPTTTSESATSQNGQSNGVSAPAKAAEPALAVATAVAGNPQPSDGRFYSPLVKNIAKKTCFSLLFHLEYKFVPKPLLTS